MTPADFRAWLRSAPGPALLDGGLSAALAAAGRAPAAGDALWTSRLLLDDPAALTDAAAAFLACGADITSSATYQATPTALAAAAGVCYDDAAALMRSGVALARRAADDASAAEASAAATAADDDDPAATSRRARRAPLVALSLGPYAAALGGGAEYRGYDESPENARRLASFHRRRAHVYFSDAGDPGDADVAAFETIPAASEAVYVAGLMTEEQMPAAAALPPFWLAFQCRDEARLANGEALADAAAAALRANAGRPGLVALGVNCADPAWLPAQVRTLRRAIADYTQELLPEEHPAVAVVIYPNSGEVWTEDEVVWPGEPLSPQAWAAQVMAAGADIVGGCCRCGYDYVSCGQSDDHLLHALLPATYFSLPRPMAHGLSAIGNA